MTQPISKKEAITYGALIVAAAIVAILLYSGYHHLQRSQSVARVSGTYISNLEFEDRLSQRRTHVSARYQEADEEALRRDVLDNMVNERLIEAYADERGITVSDNEIEARLEQAIDAVGAAELEGRLQELYGTTIDEYRLVLRADLLREKVQNHLGETSLTVWLEERRSAPDIEVYTD